LILLLKKDALKKQFEALHEMAKTTDKSFLGAVKAQEAKTNQRLRKLRKKIIESRKKEFIKKQLNRIISLQNELFPNQSLQERKINFSEFLCGIWCRINRNIVEGIKTVGK
jgi:hypothetical protein